jgi:hypothetical protein
VLGLTGTAFWFAVATAALVSAAQTITYTYDAAGRLVSAAYDDALATTFTYDATGNILAIETAPGSSDVPGGPQVDLLPTTFSLRVAAPNPFRGASTLRCQLPRTSAVRLEIYGVSGQRVRTLVHGVLPAGYYQAAWDGRDDRGHKVGSGLYFARFQAGEFAQTTPITVLR